MLYEQEQEQKMEPVNGRNTGFLRPLISSYSLHLHKEVNKNEKR